MKARQEAAHQLRHFAAFAPAETPALAGFAQQVWAPLSSLGDLPYSFRFELRRSLFLPYSAIVSIILNPKP